MWMRGENPAQMTHAEALVPYHIYSTWSYLCLGAALLLCLYALCMLKLASFHCCFLAGPATNWRWPFVIVALPSLLVTGVMLATTQEPARGITEPALQVQSCFLPLYICK